MKYTDSVDGLPRCSVMLELRLSRNEYQEVLEMSLMSRSSSVKGYLENILLDNEHLHNVMQEERRMYAIEKEDKT